MINKNKVRLVLSVDREKLNKIKKQAIDQGITLSDYVINESTKYYGYKFNEDINLYVEYIGEVKLGTEFWRVDVEFIEAKSGKWLRDMWYEVWVSQEYVEDSLRIPHSANKRDIVDFAFRFISQRYAENKNELPKEYGAFITQKNGVVLAKDRNELMWNFEQLKDITWHRYSTSVKYKLQW